MKTPVMDREPALNSQHEAFARTYASGASGAAAARSAGYSPAGAANRASELLRRPEVADRLAELSAEQASARAQAADDLLAKLEPVYAKALQADDTDAVLQVVELQARIIGLVHGGATIRPRALPAQSEPAGLPPHEAFIEFLEIEENAKKSRSASE